MIGSSLFIFSVGFFVNSVSPAYSNPNEGKNYFPLTIKSSDQKVIQVPVNEDGSVNVRLSDEQMEELKSKPLDKIGSYYFIGTGNGIYYTTSSSPTSSIAWVKIPLK